MQASAYLSALGIQCWVRRELDANAAALSTQAKSNLSHAIPAEAANVQSVDAPPWEEGDKAAFSADGFAQNIAIKNSPQAPLSTGGNEALSDTIGALRKDLSNDLPIPPVTIVPQSSWESLQTQVEQCSACPLSATRTQTVLGVGNRQADLMFIGEAPGEQEDLQGEPFVGRAGQLLNAMLAAIGLQREHVYIANVVKCRPPRNRNPQANEMQACGNFLTAQIDLIQPRLLVALGAVAARYLLQSTSSLGRLRDTLHAYQNTPLLITYHPAYLLRFPSEKAKAWHDLKQIAKTMQTW
jgi:DNA polymerase